MSAFRLSTFDVDAIVNGAVPVVTVDVNVVADTLNRPWRVFAHCGADPVLTITRFALPIGKKLVSFVLV
jgi:hypothetical protein